jgi:ribonuclease BN (tRNA processing enzyme)
VLSFGNSSGDVSMHNYTIFNNRYKSAAFMLIADDEERDYGNTEKVQPLKEKWEQSGYNVISMKDDFRTIYGDEVKKTGTFHWPEEFAEPVNAPAKTGTEQPAAEATETAEQAEAAQAETEQPASEATETAEQDAEAKTDIQYVLYLGTNDKDTNKPVFTQAEAVEKAKDILIRHFGGYTIQEAHGGWIDDGKVYQEYTIVIYLSDTTPEKVHTAADELVETFRQSSVLIHENPTKTEFYSGAK